MQAFCVNLRLRPRQCKDCGERTTRIRAGRASRCSVNVHRRHLQPVVMGRLYCGLDLARKALKSLQKARKVPFRML